MRSKTPADYYALTEKRGLRWLGPEVPDTQTKTGWQCTRGHRWQARYSQIHQRYGCPVCAGKAPKTPADYRALAQERGFRWLGPEVPDTQTKTGWECAQGHRWQARYSSVQQGSGCPACATERRVEQRRMTPADYYALAQERGFRWLGPEVSNIRTKTGWECAQGHHWQAPYNNIRHGSGCPVCAVKRRAEQRRMTCAGYHTLAEKMDFRWLGPEVSNTQTKTVWECAQGHRWQAPYNNIRRGTGCPVCAGKAPKTPVDYRALAQERGFRWRGPEVSSTKTKTDWECEQGHRWQARYNSIQQGSGCPVCAGTVARRSTD